MKGRSPHANVCRSLFAPIPLPSTRTIGSESVSTFANKRQPVAAHGKRDSSTTPGATTMHEIVRDIQPESSTWQPTLQDRCEIRTQRTL